MVVWVWLNRCICMSDLRWWRRGGGYYWCRGLVCAFVGSAVLFILWYWLCGVIRCWGRCQCCNKQAYVILDAGEWRWWSHRCQLTDEFFVADCFSSWAINLDNVLIELSDFGYYTRFARFGFVCRGSRLVFSDQRSAAFICLLRKAFSRANNVSCHVGWGT